MENTMEAKVENIVVDPQIIIPNFAAGLFGKLPVRVIGTPEEPFYYARDIADILGIKQVKASIKNFDNTEIVSPEMRERLGLVTYKKYKCDIRRDDSVILLTENGMRRLISNSRSPVAERIRQSLDDKKYYNGSIPEMKFVNSMQKAFSGENMEIQKSVLGYRIDLYFTDYNIAVEFDEVHHRRQVAEDVARQTQIENELGCVPAR